MRAEIVRLFEFVSEIDTVESGPALLDSLAARLAPFGVTCLSVNLVREPTGRLSPRGLLGRGWQSWSDFYGRSGFGAHDPAVRMLQSQSRPFAWSEAARRFDSPMGRRVLEACAEHTGSREGFVVPVRDTDRALLTAAFSGPELDLAVDARGALHLAGYWFATRGRELIDAIGVDFDCPLTPRQLECLHWVHHGKSDWEIAQILGVSPRTVHNHVEAAKAALNTPKRFLAAQEAWRRGWLHPP